MTVPFVIKIDDCLIFPKIGDYSFVPKIHDASIFLKIDDSLIVLKLTTSQILLDCYKINDCSESVYSSLFRFAVVNRS